MKVFTGIVYGMISFIPMIVLMVYLTITINVFRVDYSAGTGIYEGFGNTVLRLLVSTIITYSFFFYLFMQSELV